MKKLMINVVIPTVKDKKSKEITEIKNELKSLKWEIKELNRQLNEQNRMLETVNKIEKDLDLITYNLFYRDNDNNK